jgi:dihydroorotate dehydrogenase (NAD+) catalytic subunit
MAVEISSYYDPSLSYEDNFNMGPFGAFNYGAKYETKGSPEEQFMGEPVHLDLGIGAGTLPNSRFVVAALERGWDVAFYKTVRSDQYPCAPFPNVTAVNVIGDRLSPETAMNGVFASQFATDLGEETNGSNSFAVPSKPKDFWIPDAAHAVDFANNYPGGGKLVVVSFQGTTGKGNFLEDIRETARGVRDTGTKVAEKNMSCPNEGTNHLLCNDPEASGEAAKAAREGLGPDIKLLVKTGYMADPNLRREFMKAVSPYVDGIDAINTLPGRVLNSYGHQFFPGEGRAISGFSGGCIRWAGMEMVSSFVALREELGMNHLQIIASGGVTDPESYMKYKDIGADGVLSVIGTLRNPYLAVNTKEEVGQEVTRRW